MSAFASPVLPISIDALDQQVISNLEAPLANIKPPSGSTTGVIGGDVVVIADPNANNDPVTIVVPETGEINIASGTPGADYIIEGIGDAIIRVGNAIDADGNVLLAAGSTYQVDNDYEGTVIVNLDGAICDSVDINIITTTGLIANALPQSLSELERDFQFYFDFYVNTGAGEDQIQGSSCKDFIRAGAGNDIVNAGQGNDLVRTGSVWSLLDKVMI